MNIHFITVAYALADDLLALYEAARADNVHWHLFLHSRQPDVLHVCRYLESCGQVTLYDYGVNRGLARSWNDGLIAAYGEGADVALIANDDALPAPGDVQHLAAYAVAHPDVARVTGWGYDRQSGAGDMRFALAAINPVALATIGYFDENFWPIYYEDWDWYRRERLAGLTHICLPDTDILHQGSKSLVQDTAHHARFVSNQTYFRTKWGADAADAPGFDYPFDDVQLGLCIPAERRHTPYPCYNREGIPA